MDKEIEDKESSKKEDKEYEERLSKMNIFEKIMHYAYICCKLVDEIHKIERMELLYEYKETIMEYLNKVLVLADKDPDEEFYLKLKENSWECFFRVMRNRKTPIELVNNESLGNFHASINHLEEQFNEIIENRKDLDKEVGERI